MSDLSEAFYTERGLRQGDALACMFFNIALEKAIRDAGITTKGTIFHRSIQILAYADDIDIIGRTKQAVVETFIALESAAKDIGLSINKSKTKFMTVSSRTCNSLPLQVNSYSFESVDQFTYLGTMISKDNCIKLEIDNRLTRANRSYHGLKNILKSKLLSVKTRINIYTTLIRPIILYGSECLPLTKSDEERLLIFERKILGPIKENNQWRILFNHEVYRKYQQPKITRVIKSNRIRWLGHIFRCDDSNPVKKVTFANVEGTRKRGRPRTRWIDCVEADLEVLKVNRWRALAADRVRWRKFIETALACTRL